MKFTIVLCLALAVGSNVYGNEDLEPLMNLQHRAMQRLISSHAANDDPLKVAACFDEYMLEQQGVITNYNIQYSGCVRTAQNDKTELTAQSEANRRQLLSRSENMCSALSICEGNVDALEFFDCYREASADSYKITFTLNSDANILYNTISSKYDIIDADLTNCVDVARLEYGRDLEKCDSKFNECVNGPPEEPAESTAAPVEPTQEPAQPTQEPAESTAAPVEPTQEPAESTAAPVEPTQEPAESTAAPVEPTQQPAESTAAPVEPTQQPAESTAAPAEPTQEPAESTAAPVDPTESPAQSTAAPVDPTEEPVVSTEEPANPTTEKMPEEDVERVPAFFRKLIHFF